MKYLSLGQQKVLFLLALLILALIYYKFYYRPASPPEETYQEVVVELLGEVQRPGVYIFKNSPTLIEVVEQAGGLKGNIPLDQGVSSEIMETGTLINAVREEGVIPPYPPLAKGGEREILAKGGEGGILEKRGSRQALDAGLIDAIGELDDAIAEAKRAAGIDGDTRVVVYRRGGESADNLFSVASGPLGAEAARVGLRDVLAESSFLYWWPGGSGASALFELPEAAAKPALP